MRGVTKTFGRVVANNKVDMEIRTGEILSLLGENGSGKTTLMNMLSGIYFPDEGQIYVHGKPVTIRSPKDAFDLGIGMIHQHFKLVDVLTATENILLGLHEKGALNLKAAAEKADSNFNLLYNYEDPGNYSHEILFYRNFTPEIQRHVNSLWEELKIHGTEELWVHITSAVLVGTILIFAIYSAVVKKKRSKDYRMRDKALKVTKSGNSN